MYNYIFPQKQDCGMFYATKNILISVEVSMSLSAFTARVIYRPAVRGCPVDTHSRKKPRPFSRGLVFALPIFTVRAIYRPAVRGCPVDTHRQKKAPTFQSRLGLW